MPRKVLSKSGISVSIDDTRLKEVKLVNIVTHDGKIKILLRVQDDGVVVAFLKGTPTIGNAVDSAYPSVKILTDD